MTSGHYAEDLTGKIFRGLKVLKQLPTKESPSGKKRARWEVQCLGCDRIFETDTYKVKHNINCAFCNILRGENHPNFKHGLSKHLLFKLRTNIIQRCYNPKDHNYCNYGGRGISVYLEWKVDFMSFYNYCYELYPNIDFLLECGYQIDRINVDGNYEPGNIRFVSSKINNQNRRNNRTVIIDDQSMPLAEAIDNFALDGLEYNTVLYRINHGWEIKKALRTPAGDTWGKQARHKKTNVIYTFRGHTACLAELVELYSKQDYGTVQYRLKKGYNIEKALLAPGLTNKSMRMRYEDKFGPMSSPYAAGVVNYESY